MNSWWSMEIDENMWRDLECPVCFETVNSTVHVCSNGHHVCNSCRPKLTTCPQCRSTFMNAKIQLLDYFMKFAYIQCSNTKYGCTSIVKIKDIPTHKEDCLYNSFKCPVNECGVNVRMKSLVVHFEQEHRDIAMHSLHNESSAVGNIEWTSRNILKDSLIILNFQIGYMSEKFVYQCKREKSNFLLFYVQYLVCVVFFFCVSNTT